jgi:hypothetical protein
LLKPERYALRNALLYGITSIGDGSVIEIADTQIGNVGGEPYWSWYGFMSRVEWCACFVSWCAGQLGYIDAGVLPLLSCLRFLNIIYPIILIVNAPNTSTIKSFIVSTTA